MVSYLLRRLLLMPITLLGITVMVFLIARCAPGKPGQLQQRGEQTVTAEEAQALREWYEKRYGLDLPIHMQYFRWWSGLFTKDIQAAAWFEAPGASAGSPLGPVFTYRSAQAEYFARDAAGGWYQVTGLDFEHGHHLADDPAFLASVSPDDFELHPDIRPEYLTPAHLFVNATLIPIESLAEDVQNERLERAEVANRVRMKMQVPTWSQDGEPLFVNPDDPDRPLVREGPDWFVIDPTMRPLVKDMNDEASLRPVLGSMFAELPQPEKGYAIPRHAVYYGTRARVAPEDVPADPQRLYLDESFNVPAGLWVEVPGSDRRAMLWEQAEPQPILFVRNQDGAWKRLIGPSRVRPPDVEITLQTDDDFQARLSSQSIEELPEIEGQPRTPRHAILSGELVDPVEEPSDRRIRRHQHETRIFEVTLGESVQTGATVMDELKRRLPITLMINVIAFPLIYALAIPTGMLMAIKRGRFFDTAGNVILLGFWSVPTVLSATLLIGYVGIGGTGLELFPTAGLHSANEDAMPFLEWLNDLGMHIVLPVFCITYGGLAYLAKQMRAAMLDNFTMDYVRTARAKGVPGRQIVFRHVLRNSLLPIITIFATILPALIAGSIIIEKIFSIEGMGMLAFRAVESRDYDVVQSLALIAGALNLTGLLLADICYAVADPRITYS